ncbi:unnamed protein product [Paramecium octaurelia]|uniref:WD40-repeat-containing domain n=1 Tax=Paramecium octaurelia TaxID=43137 RepID=A0A8S1YN72_PAROT|nr:unnamed protein product [Paramecium octaurelia]
MFQPKMIENEKDICCQYNHGQPIHLVMLDPNIKMKERFLCIQCLENYDQNGRTMGFKKLIQHIEDAIEKKMSNLADITSNTIQNINMCITSTQEFKTYFMKLLDSIIRIAEDWTQDLLVQRQQWNQYFNLPQKQEIKLKLIDQSVKQEEQCNVIVFDSSGSIMVSTEKFEIKVWSFLNGTIKLVQTLQGHTDWVQCLVYSKKQNSFISCSFDKTIRCWQQLNQYDWISSQPYQQHTSYVFCILLNQNEDLLFSGSNDKSIKVWKVDFNQNQLIFLYSLDKHNNQVTSLSLNQSEDKLVSCAKGQNQIIIWERRQNNQFEFKYFVKQSIQEKGLKVKFIKDNQFIWITGGEEIDKLYVFEIEQGIFQENKDKAIQLIANNQILDEYRFPIVYNKERNLILVRHKTYIYIIREINDAKYKIYHQLNCETICIQGTITNNGQYLVYWDDNQQGYSTYELLNQ